MSNSMKKRTQDYRVINKGRIMNISCAPRKELSSKQSVAVRSLGTLNSKQKTFVTGVKVKVLVTVLSDSVTPQTGTHQAPLSVEFCAQE